MPLLRFIQLIGKSSVVTIIKLSAQDHFLPMAAADTTSREVKQQCAPLWFPLLGLVFNQPCPLSDTDQPGIGMYAFLQITPIDPPMQTVTVSTKLGLPVSCIPSETNLTFYTPTYDRLLIFCLDA